MDVVKRGDQIWKFNFSAGEGVSCASGHENCRIGVFASVTAPEFIRDEP
jgi:hypothetical protein